MMKEVFRTEGFRLMGAAFAVYNELGYGMAEEIYQESLEHELHLQGIPFTAKPEIRCEYKGHQLNKRYIPDLVVSGSLVVELKAVTALASEHEAQLLNYLRISRRPVGYLLNFGHKNTLEWKRLIVSEFIPASA
jgi:GxxExxY protein